MHFRYIKAFIYAAAALAFTYMLLHPRVKYLDAGFNVIINYPRVMALGLLAVLHLLFASAEILNSQKYIWWHRLLQAAKVVYLFPILYCAHRMFMILPFYQKSDYIITIVHLLPFPLVMYDLLKKIRFSPLFPALAGFILILITFIYFSYFDAPTEEYLYDLPVTIIHGRVRNWLYFTGITLLMIAVMRFYTNRKVSD